MVGLSGNVEAYFLPNISVFALELGIINFSKDLKDNKPPFIANDN